MSSNTSEKPIINISVMGVGDAGNNAIDNIQKNNFQDVNFLYVNTDKKTLSKFDKDKIILLDDGNKNIGSSGNPLLGKKAAIDSINQIKETLSSTDLLILTGGLGGGTGTGALPIIANAAKSMGILTIAVVTTPFSYEGATKDTNARIGLDELKENCDSVVVISNNRLINNYPDIAATDAFKVVNNILKNCVKAFINLVSKNSVIPISIADLTTAIKDKGKAYIGFGNGFGRNKIMKAVNGSINSKIIDVSIRNASNVLLYIVGDPTITINQIQDVVDIIKQKTKNNKANIVFGYQVNQNLVNEMQICVIATFEKPDASKEKSLTDKKLQNSQELLIEIGNTLENELSSYATGELDIPKFDIEKNNSHSDDKDQDEFFINSDENAEDDDIPFFLK